MFTLTGRKESDPSVVGHKGMNGEWKLHSFQAKIKTLDNFVSPLVNLKLRFTMAGFSLLENRIIFSLELIYVYKYAVKPNESMWFLKSSSLQILAKEMFMQIPANVFPSY